MAIKSHTPETTLAEHSHIERETSGMIKFALNLIKAKKKDHKMGNL